jgi:hypothetical protein
MVVAQMVGWNELACPAKPSHKLTIKVVADEVNPEWRVDEIGKWPYRPALQSVAVFLLADIRWYVLRVTQSLSNKGTLSAQKFRRLGGFTMTIQFETWAEP